MLHIVGDLIIRNAEFTKWDLDRFKDKVKNGKVRTDGSEHDSDANLVKFFEAANIGKLNLPTTVLDRFGRVMVWALPGVLHPKRVVSQST